MAATYKHPIWKDFIIKGRNTQSDTLSYRLEFGDNDVYEGSVVIRDNEYEFKINDIISDKLNNHDIVFEEKKGNHLKNSKGLLDVTIYLSFNNFSTVSNYGTFTFIYDWSYGDDSISDLFRTDTIQDFIDPRQYFVFTVYNDTTYYYNAVSGGSIIFYVQQDNDNFQNLIYDMSIAPVSKPWPYFEFGESYRWEVKQTCKDYCLYYINEKGGWCWLLVEGSATKSIAYTRDTYEENYYNATDTYTALPANTGVRNYNTVKQESWKLNTGYLTDIQSEKMQQFFSSNQVYLHDLNKNIIYPVMIDNKSIDVKTFKNQGRQMFNYTMNVKACNKKLRK